MIFTAKLRAETLSGVQFLGTLQAVWEWIETQPQGTTNQCPMDEEKNQRRVNRWNYSPHEGALSKEEVSRDQRKALKVAASLKAGGMSSPTNDMDKADSRFDSELSTDVPMDSDTPMLVVTKSTADYLI
ncbi:hypothetical protein NDU88_005783 [Pleurodeles waltl]|uniref:Uncharacterized protein n=1 Tax=Pleurodeles waltl TaxID=8319 RepID=A0AAV7N1J2_PLEWA|nr:hypothetical protein NDU88_005783 [Pleurodeles waltl]